MLAVAGFTLSGAFLPVTLIVLGVAAAIAAVVLVITHWTEITRTAVAVWNGVAQAFRVVWEIIQKSPLGPFVNRILQPFMTVIVLIGAGLKLLPGLLDAVGKAAEKVAGPIKAVLDTAGKLLGGAGGAAGSFLNWAGASKADNPFISHPAVKPPAHAVLHQHVQHAIHHAVTHVAHHVNTHTVNNTVLHHAVTHVAQHTVAHTQVSPAHSGHGGGAATVHHAETHNHTNHFHIHGADSRTTEHLARVVAKHVNAAQGRDLGHTARNRPLVQHGGLVPGY